MLISGVQSAARPPAVPVPAPQRGSLGGAAAAEVDADARQHGRAMAGLCAACCALTASQSRRGRCPRAPQRQGPESSSGNVPLQVTELDLTAVRDALQSCQAESVTLSRFLVEDSSFLQEFVSMQPLVEADVDPDWMRNDSPMEQLHIWKQRGLADFNMLPKQIQTDAGETILLVLCVCNANSGVVCGFGAHRKGAGLRANKKDKKKTKQLAAQQVLERLMQKSDPTDELRLASQLHKEGQIALETLQVLSDFISDLKLIIRQPFGRGFQASLEGAFQGRSLVATSRKLSDSKELAVAKAGEAFLQQIRSALRVPIDAPHAPQDWADQLTYDVKNETLHVPDPPEESLAQLLELLGSESQRAEVATALEAACARQEQRLRSLEEMSSDSQIVSNLQADNGIVARRCWEVTKPEDDDWRREEIKGKLPAEEVRQQISQALERKQVVIVSGGTGSGKSTQLPQFILDDFRTWEAEGDMPEPVLTLEPGAIVDVEWEDVWYACEIMEVAPDTKTVTVKYFDGGDEEPDVDVATRVKAGRPLWMSMPPRIVITQPKRIAAISLAQRVAWERSGEVGGEVGHAVRGDTIMPSEEHGGSIEFCTVGTLLRRVVTDPLLSRYNVVVLDEVHERDLMTDFLLILLKEVIDKRPDLRLVLMSATLDVQTFTNYLSGAAVVEVPSGTRYPVEEIHLEDPFFQQFSETKKLLTQEAAHRTAAPGAGEMHEFTLAGTSASQQEVEDTAAADEGEEGEDEEDSDSTPPLASLQEQIWQMTSYSDEVKQAWSQFQEQRDQTSEMDTTDLLEFMNTQGVKPWSGGKASWEVTSSATWWGSDSNDMTFIKLAEETIVKVYPQLFEFSEDDEVGVGSVLCFLPGWAEIKRLADRLETSPHAGKLWVLKLHSTVTKEEQQQIFEEAPEGKVKVVLGTNIAESSVTINDVRVVIDAGLHRELSYDPRRRMSSLDTVWICQSNAVQRKGRAGRVRTGKVYRLYSRDHFKSVPWRPAPEMQRCNLANTCLQTISLGRDPRDFLARAPDPPLVSAVEAAMAELRDIDAIQDGCPPLMRPLGQVLCRFPLEPLLGRAMVLGTLFDMPQLTAAMIAVLGGSSVFITAREVQAEAMKSMRDFCNYSDVMASLRAIVEFERIYREHGEMKARVWCQHYYVNYNRCMVLSRVKHQLLVDVQRSGLLGCEASEGTNPDEWGFGYYDVDEEQAAASHMESAGSIFEVEENSSMLGYRDWLKEIRSGEREVEREPLLIGILTSAFPTNLAYRHEPHHKMHITGSGSKSVIASRSVNSNLRETEDADVLVDGPSWWLYKDLRLFNGQISLTDTTLVSPWHAALFGGMRVRENPHPVFDGWIDVQCQSSGSKELLTKLRQEVQQAPVWLSIATSFDKVARCAVQRSKAVFCLIGNFWMAEELDEEKLEFLKSWKLPEIQEGSSTLEASEEDRDEILESLRFKKVAELKVMLRELGEKVSGRKQDLIDRLADALLYGGQADY
eukprot:TRINITY_DN106246_c0_g1_i1.p1 TRINITY_DN106246_c0_g1~~TRINITY_DN106246_c0_g1_i1.p1  ORF type:complete len:1504 (-),score=385.33 TRINITY_DN106246_c0_g1_i1:4-4470(-)